LREYDLYAADASWNTMLVFDISNIKILVSITTEGCATVPFHGRGLQSMLVCTTCSLFL